MVVKNISSRKRLFLSVRKRLMFLLVLFCFYTAFASPQKGAQWLVITNTTAMERTGEVIAIKRVLLGKENSLIPQIKKGTIILTSQLIDKDNNGDWDELLVEINLAPYTKDTLQIEWVNAKDAVAFPVYTGVRLSLRSDTETPSPQIKKEVRLRGFTQNIAKPYYQMEGPGIENNKVAFRTFFDARNGKDIFGKIVDTPVLYRVGVGRSWHDLQPWGMDIFHTGNSLGAGGLAVEEQDKIYRLGDADTATFTSMYEGPLSAAFCLNFKGWDVGTGKGDGSETIAIIKGTFYYKNEIALDLNKLQQLVAGIANFGTDKVVYKKQASTFSSLSIYGAQAEGTNTKLGVAILFPTADYVTHNTTDSASSIPNTSYISLRPSANGKTTIYFFACWEKTDSRFSTEQGFEEYLDVSAEALAHPIQVRVINQKLSKK